MDKFQSSQDFCRDHKAAVAYIESRPEHYKDGEGSVIAKFMKDLKWVYRTESTIQADVYGCTIIHELRPGSLHCFPIWGELCYNNTAEKEPELFDSLECFVAFCMARWW